MKILFVKHYFIRFMTRSYFYLNKIFQAALQPTKNVFCLIAIRYYNFFSSPRAHTPNCAPMTHEKQGRKVKKSCFPFLADESVPRKRCFSETRPESSSTLGDKVDVDVDL